MEGGMGGLAGTMDQRISAHPFYFKFFTALDRADLELFGHTPGRQGQILHFDGHYYVGLADRDGSTPVPENSMNDNTGGWLLQLAKDYQQSGDVYWLRQFGPHIRGGLNYLRSRIESKRYQIITGATTYDAGDESGGQGGLARHVAFGRRRALREVCLPEGGWRDFWTGKVLTGGQHHVVTATAECPPVFVRAGTLLPLAEPLLAIDDKTLFTVHLAAYGKNPRPCQLLEDDGLTLDYEKGNWATLTVRADGTIQRPNHGQPQRYRIVGTAKAPQALLEHLLTTQ